MMLLRSKGRKNLKPTPRPQQGIRVDLKPDASPDDADAAPAARPALRVLNLVGEHQGPSTTSASARRRDGRGASPDEVPLPPADHRYNPEQPFDEEEDFRQRRQQEEQEQRYGNGDGRDAPGPGEWDERRRDPRGSRGSRGGGDAGAAVDELEPHRAGLPPVRPRVGAPPSLRGSRNGSDGALAAQLQQQQEEERDSFPQQEPSPRHSGDRSRPESRAGGHGGKGQVIEIEDDGTPSPAEARRLRDAGPQRAWRGEQHLSPRYGGGGQDERGGGRSPPRSIRQDSERSADSHHQDYEEQQQQQQRRRDGDGGRRGEQQQREDGDHHGRARSRGRRDRARSPDSGGSVDYHAVEADARTESRLFQVASPEPVAVPTDGFVDLQWTSPAPELPNAAAQSAAAWRQVTQTDEQAEEAAVRIQAAFRGGKARREVDVIRARRDLRMALAAARSAPGSLQPEARAETTALYTVSMHHEACTECVINAGPCLFRRCRLCTACSVSRTRTCAEATWPWRSSATRSRWTRSSATTGALSSEPGLLTL